MYLIVQHHQHHLPLFTMVSLSTNAALLRAAIASSTLLRAAEAGYAPKEKPNLPAGFCPKGTGTVTDTTGGECRARIVARPFPLRVRYLKSCTIKLLCPRNDDYLTVSPSSLPSSSRRHFFSRLSCLRPISQKSACVIGSTGTVAWGANASTKWV